MAIRKGNSPKGPYLRVVFCGHNSVWLHQQLEILMGIVYLYLGCSFFKIRAAMIPINDDKLTKKQDEPGETLFFLLVSHCSTAGKSLTQSHRGWSARKRFVGGARSALWRRGRFIPLPSLRRCYVEMMEMGEISDVKSVGYVGYVGCWVVILVVQLNICWTCQEFVWGPAQKLAPLETSTHRIRDT